MYNAGIADGIWIPSATEVEAWERVEFCAENGRDELLRQWDTEKNGGKTPDDAFSGSSAMAWWRCDKGHSFPMRIAFRTTREQGCPYCAGRRVLAGFNDLAAVAPDVAAEWHPTLNGELRPEMIMAGSSRHVWWQCPQGHVWRARVDTRIGAQHSGCPACAGKQVLPGFNDLASQKPALAAQWDAARNGTLTPEQVTPASNRKAWWRCEKGHSFQAVIASRANGSGCPYCTNKKVLAGFNDLATVEPKIAAEWHPTPNGALTPGMVTAGSRKKVWWQCSCGHIWSARIGARTGAQRSGCPVCAGSCRRHAGTAILPCSRREKHGGM